MMPNAVPEPVAYPAVDINEFVVNTSHTEVIYPARLNFVQFLDAFVKAHWSGLAGDVFELLL